MANAAIVAINLADDGSLTASPSASLMPVSLLQNPHVSKVWRSITSPHYVICDLGFSASIDVVALFGMTASANSSVRVRASSSDPTVTSSLDFDSGTIDDGDPEFDTRYGSLIYLRGTPVTTRYVRIDITEFSLTYVGAGKILIGLKEVFTYNFAPGARRGWTDRSRREESPGGQTLIFPDNKYRTFEVNFDWVPKDQQDGLWETLGRLNGNSEPVLFMLDTDSDKLPMHSVYGLVISPPGSSMYTSIPDIASAPLAVKERL